MTAELVPLPEPEPALDTEAAREALAEASGNVTEAAKTLKVEPARLRRMVEAMPRLKGVIDEAMEQGVDKAISVLQGALDDEMSFQNRFYAAKEFLRSAPGRKRGFGGGYEPAQAVEVTRTNAGVITLKWLEPTDE